MLVWNPHADLGGNEDRDVKEATFLLWRGWCSVHQRFRPEHAAAFRAEHPGGEVIVHPECSHDVVEVADRVGSTERILEWVEAAPAGRRARDRHRDPHGAAHGAGAPGQDDRLARSARLPVLDHVPHRRARTSRGASSRWSTARWSTRSRSTPRRPSGPEVALAADARHHLTRRRYPPGELARSWRAAMYSSSSNASVVFR